jgi:hypothetical protein
VQRGDYRGALPCLSLYLKEGLGFRRLAGHRAWPGRSARVTAPLAAPAALLPSVSPKILEPVGGKLAVAHAVLNVFMTEIPRTGVSGC